VKILGALLLIGYLLRALARDEDVRLPATLPALVAFTMLILLSLMLSGDVESGLSKTLRYLLFAAFTFLVVQLVRSRAELLVLLRVLVISSTLAALYGAVNFVTGNVERVSGPIGEANDFAYVLASVLPFAVYLTLRDRRFRLGHSRFGDQKLRLRGPLPVGCDFNGHAGIVQILLRNQPVFRQLFGAIAVPFRKRHVDAFRLDFVFRELSLCRFHIRLGAQEDGSGFVESGLKVLLVQFYKDLPFLNQIADLDFDFLDNAICLGLDLDFRYGFDLPDCNHRSCQISALNFCQT